MNDSARTMRLAGIDIGTLTCRLLIADLPHGGRLKEVRSERQILRLGAGVDQTKQLSVVAMDRVLQCLRAWREMIDVSHVDATAAVATSAVRDAENRDEFLDRVKREVGFEVELISGEEEARRTMLGIRSGLPPGVTDVLALDIGGGSTEFILDRPGQKPVVRSIDIGVVRLCERHLPTTLRPMEKCNRRVSGSREKRKQPLPIWATIKQHPSSAQLEPSPALPRWPRNFPPMSQPEFITISCDSARFKHLSRHFSVATKSTASVCLA